MSSLLPRRRSSADYRSAASDPKDPTIPGPSKLGVKPRTQFFQLRLASCVCRPIGQSRCRVQIVAPIKSSNPSQVRLVELANLILITHKRKLVYDNPEVCLTTGPGNVESQPLPFVVGERPLLWRMLALAASLCGPQSHALVAAAQPTPYHRLPFEAWKSRLRKNCSRGGKLASLEGSGEYDLRLYGERGS
jgi:hypothetical protein